SGSLLNLHGMALEALASLDHSDYRLCGLVLSKFTSHGNQVGPHHFMARGGEPVRQCRIVGEQEEAAGRLIEPPDCMQISQIRRQYIEDCSAALLVTVRRDHPFGFMKKDKSFDRILDQL